MALRRRKARPRAEEYPSSDGVPMDSEQHAENTRSGLIDPLRLWCERTGFTAFVGGNSFVYYGATRHEFVGPDFYVVNGGARRGQGSWIVSREHGLMPTLVMEFLSPSTRAYDQTGKLELYRDKLRVRDYFLVDDGPTVRGFHLQGGQYVAIVPNEHGRLPCASLPLEVGVHDGWVRFFEPDGQTGGPSGRTDVTGFLDRWGVSADHVAAAASPHFCVAQVGPADPAGSEALRLSAVARPDLARFSHPAA